MLERFNGRISQLLAQTQFRSSQHLRDKLEEYLMLYNHHILQRNLGHVSPMTKLREWQKNNPDLFTKNLSNQSSADTSISQLIHGNKVKHSCADFLGGAGGITSG
ncbi:MAG: hypothetical protein IE936_10510 [Moraxella osloensis]|nr:hypothetical protein [Moraxella osloensis]